MVYDKLMTFFEENPAVAKAIFEKAQAARAREAAKKARDLARRKVRAGTAAMPASWRTAPKKTPPHRNLHRRG